MSKTLPFANKKKSVLDRLNRLLKVSEVQLAPRAKRGFAARQDDVFIVSYPRSGTYWFRFLIANMLHPQAEIDFSNIRAFVPGVEQKNQRQIAQMPSPRFLWSHLAFMPEYSKVIYIVRDPKSVAVSEFYFLKRRRVLPEEYSFPAYMELFLNGFPPNTSRILYGTWATHVGSWVGAGQSLPRWLYTVRYEDLKQSIEQTLQGVATFLGLSLEPEQLQQAIERSRFDRMQALHNQQAAKREVNAKYGFIRKSDPEEWKEHFDAAMLQKLGENAGYWMHHFGYTWEH